MEESIVLFNIREWQRHVEYDFPFEHFGVADRMLLNHVILANIEKWEKSGQGRNTRSRAFIECVRCDMEDLWGYKPRERCLEWP